MAPGIRRFIALFFTAAALLLAACGPTSTGGGVNIPAPSRTATLRPGDSLVVDLLSIPKPQQLQVQVNDQGHIILPLIQSVNAVGQTESQLAGDIRQAYIDGRYYTNIDVSVTVSARYIYVGGEVQRPGRVPWSPDLTLTKAVQSAGGFGLYANKTDVQLTRDDRTHEVNARNAQSNPSADPKLYPGDSINVKRSSF